MGIVKAPEIKPYGAPKAKKEKAPKVVKADNDAELSEIDEDVPSDSESEAEANTDRSRKRKRKAAEEDLEDTYMRKLAEDEPTPKNKKTKADEPVVAIGDEQEEEAAAGSGAEDDSDSDDEDVVPTPGSNIKHETQISEADIALDKATRTVFLGNVPSNAISSKSDYKKLKAFFSTAGKIASVRFRSIAFSEQIPRKAAFVNHKLHEKQKTVNCYVVYKEAAGAREACKLNGSVVLDRHIRVDSIAHPGKHEHKQCIFVGNLDFEAQEENLWRHFGVCGKIEYVRVVRDPKTNVGKGFAYVQFVVSSPAPSSACAAVLTIRRMSIRSSRRCSSTTRRWRATASCASRALRP